MKEVTLMVTDEVCEALERLVINGHLNTNQSGSNYTAFNLALMTRPVKGDRWIKLPRFCGWARLPETISYGGK